MKRDFIIILIFLILLVFGILFYISTPQFFIKKYVNAFVRQDCKKMYEFSVNYNSLTGEENYKKACELKIEKIDNYDVKVNKEYAILSYNGKNIKIEYERNEDVLIGLNRYKVTNGLVDVLENITLYVPIDSANVLLNNYSLYDYKVEYENPIYDKYIIPYLYNMDYQLEGIYSEIKFERDVTFEENTEKYIEFENNPIEITVFNQSKCVYCVDLFEFYNRLSNEYKNLFTVKNYDIANQRNLQNFDNYVKMYNIKVEGVPLSIIGDDYISGYTSDMEDKYLFKIFDAYRKQ